MQAQAIISIVETIAKAAGHIATYLTQGWQKVIPVAAVALATAMAMGLVELAMALGFKALGAGLKTAGKAAKQGLKTVTKGTQGLIKGTAKGVKSLLKSGVKLVSRSGNMIIRNGKLVLKGLQKGVLKGVTKLQNFVGKILNKFKFKRFKTERKGDHIRVYGEVNPWVLLYDGTVVWKDKDEPGKTHLGQKVKVGDADGVVVGIRKDPSKAVNEMLENAKDTKGLARNKELYEEFGNKGVSEADDIAARLRSNPATYYSYDELHSMIKQAGLSRSNAGFEAHHLLAT